VMTSSSISMWLTHAIQLAGMPASLQQLLIHQMPLHNGKAAV
jgi:hypothetical protein